MTRSNKINTFSCLNKINTFSTITKEAHNIATEMKISEGFLCQSKTSLAKTTKTTKSSFITLEQQHALTVRPGQQVKVKSNN